MLYINIDATMQVFFYINKGLRVQRKRNYTEIKQVVILVASATNKFLI